jgi:uncharacterized protein
MKLFADTSALVKRYIEESGSDRVDELFFYADGIIISPVTRIELNSAFSRRLLDKSIDKKSSDMALSEFNKELEFFKVIAFNNHVEDEAVTLIKKHGMKTLDAIQLSSVKLSDADSFITSDKRLYDIAIKELSGECVFI